MSGLTPEQQPHSPPNDEETPTFAGKRMEEITVEDMDRYRLEKIKAGKLNATSIALTWADIDLASGTITVGGVAEGAGKSQAAARTVNSCRSFATSSLRTRRAGSTSLVGSCSAQAAVVRSIAVRRARILSNASRRPTSSSLRRSRSQYRRR
jgi:hypothetical protein